MVEPWYMDTPFKVQQTSLSKQQLLKLRRFYMQQLALSQELLAAKPLGICKITISEESQLLDTFLEEEEAARCILSREGSKEMSS